MNEYIPYYEEKIDYLLADVEIDMTKNNKTNYSYSHSIIYTTDDIYLEFTFINNKSFAKCLIDCYFYELSCEELLNNDSIDVIINIIEEFGIDNIYDFHNGYDNVLASLNDNISTDDNNSYQSYYYHDDSLVGNLGYYYELNPSGDSATNYFDPSGFENRPCFQMNYTAILNGIS